MRISSSTHVPATPDRVFAEISTQDFQDAKCVATRPLSHSATVSTDGPATVLHTERQMPSDGLPDVVAKFVGPSITIVEDQHWGPAEADGTRRATLTVKVPGAPFDVTGQATMTPNGGGTQQSVDLDVSCSVPLFGRKIEAAVAPMVEKAVTSEFKVLHARLD